MSRCRSFLLGGRHREVPGQGRLQARPKRWLCRLFQKAKPQEPSITLKHLRRRIRFGFGPYTGLKKDLFSAKRPDIRDRLYVWLMWPSVVDFGAGDGTFRLRWGITFGGGQAGKGCYPGIPRRTTQPGNRRQGTFFSADDHRNDLELMAKWCNRSKVEVWAYCLTPNHRKSV
jgi:hypothetical protein